MCCLTDIWWLFETCLIYKKNTKRSNMCWKITQWVLGIILSSSRLKVSLLNWHKHKYECLSWPWMFAWLHTSLESPVSIWQRCLIPSLFEEVTCFDVYNRFIRTGLRCVSVGFVLIFKTFCTLNTCHTCLWLGWLLYRNDTHLNYVSEAYRQKKKKHRHHFLKICKLETNPSKLRKTASHSLFGFQMSQYQSFCSEESRKNFEADE